MVKGTTGLAKALVLVATAVSMADDRTENTEMQTSVRDAALTSTAMNALANCFAAPTKKTDTINPSIDWKRLENHPGE